MSWCYPLRNESKFWTNIAIGQEDNQKEDLSKHDVGSSFYIWTPLLLIGKPKGFVVMNKVMFQSPVPPPL